MTDRELMQQALEALDGVEALLTSMDVTHLLIYGDVDNAIAALHERLAQPEMQPCAGRNCGSTNPNLHSAECFEDYEKSTGMNQWQQVDLTYHGDGTVGIGTPPDASAPMVMGEPIERLRVSLTDGAQEERNKLAAWMMAQGYATGHGETVEDLLKELEWQIEESVRNERSACAKVCDVLAVHPEYASDITKVAAQAIRARGNT